MIIQENVPLAPFTTFRIGGPARFFVQAKSTEEIIEACNFANKKNLKYKVLGGGSNVLVADSGFDGLVIKNELRGIVEENVTVGDMPRPAGALVRIIAGSGEDWDAFVGYVVGKNLHGLENLSFIPGTVGASPVQNIGAYGAEVKDTIEWVEVYNPKNKKIEKITNADCRFAYRDSVFKHKRQNNIILRVAFLLQKNGITQIEYKDLKNYFAEHKIEPTLQNVRKAVIEIRTKKLPDISKIGTAGSFFKNAIITKAKHQKLAEKYGALPLFPVSENHVKVPIAWILDHVCGFKAARRGNVGVYENQALALVNFGGGTAQEVKALAKEMIDSVKEKTGITIVPEVELI